MKSKIVLIIAFCAIIAVAAYILGVRNKNRTARVGVSEQSAVTAGMEDQAQEYAERAEGQSRSEEMTPEKLEALTTASAQITRADKSVINLRAVDHETECIILEPNELLKIQLALKNPEEGQGILIEADHGGTLNHRLGPIVITPEPGADAIEFDYAVGGHNGRYTLLVSQGNRQELIEFRVGAEPPIGKPGPQRTFTFDKTIKE